MRRTLLDLKIMILANLWLMPVLAGLLGAVFYLVAPPPSMFAVMATGSAGGGYTAFAEKLKTELAKQDFELILVPSAGSQDNLQKLLDDHSEVQLALVQSGLERQLPSADFARLQSLGGMYQEPLWLFFRSEVTLKQIADLLPLRLALGVTNSGTLAASTAILAVNDIPQAQYPSTWQTIGGQTAATALMQGELDAGFFVAPAENSVIQQLAAHPQLQLASFHRAAAYRARLRYLRKVTVGEGLLNLAQNRPDHEVVVLALVATLVVNSRFNPALTPLILQAARDVMHAGTLLDPPGEFPSANPQTFALASDAEHYYTSGLPLLQRYLPFRIASLADRYIILLIPLLMILFPLFKTIGPLYRWRIRNRIYRWYKYLREIDRKLDGDTSQEVIEAQIVRLEELEAQLVKVEVPLSYSNELYELHVHLRYVIERLQALQQRHNKLG
ncbi:MAG: TRAP-type uncharacterized transport system substrate-binding protein [Pseudomonas sp.]|jgi:TRAP-type uncharacterized transport system substrate-binding protein